MNYRARPCPPNFLFLIINGIFQSHHVCVGSGVSGPPLKESIGPSHEQRLSAQHLILPLVCPMRTVPEGKWGRDEKRPRVPVLGKGGTLSHAELKCAELFFKFIRRGSLLLLFTLSEIRKKTNTTVFPKFLSSTSILSFVVI